MQVFIEPLKLVEGIHPRLMERHIQKLEAALAQYDIVSTGGGPDWVEVDVRQSTPEAIFQWLHDIGAVAVNVMSADVVPLMGRSPVSLSVVNRLSTDPAIMERLSFLPVG